jgi:5-methylcytosine-specific restriction protein A
MPRRVPTFRPPWLARKREPRPNAAARGYCTPQWQRTRLAVIARDAGICQLCGQLVRGENGEAHIDHIIEKARGGSDALQNLRLVHRSCHSKRHASEQF